jgi:hypothetical protein
VSWLRVDDGFTGNAKIIQLTDREFRVWMRLLCHCARTRDPSVDKIALNEVAGLSKALVARFAKLELLDVVGDAFEVHDWPQYQPKDATSAERQAAWRARKAVTDAVTQTVTETVTSLACAREPVPVPVSPKAFDLPTLVREM